MAVPPRVVRWVDDNYRRPRVDPEWLNECYAWLTTEGGQDPDRNFQGLVDAIEHQILESNFQDSMLPGTGLPTHVALPSTTLTVKGVLVEVISRMEIAYSAFSLNQTLMAREERLKTGDVEDEGGEGDIDVAGEGPLPKYTRGMLKFDLTDGTTMLPAMEYRPLPELSLESTPLGYKMLLRDVRVNRGIAFLEPKSVVLLGHKTDDRDETRQADFARGLRARIGLPEPPSDTENNVVPALIPRNPSPQAPRYPSPATIRSPLREISPPPSPPAVYLGHHDEDLGARRRRIPNRNPDLLSANARPVLSSSCTATTSSYFTNSTASGSRSRTVTGSAPFNPASILSLSPTLRNTMRPLYTDSPPPSPGPQNEHFWSDNEAENEQRASLSGDQRFVPGFGNSGVKFPGEIKARNTAPAQNGGAELQNGGITNGKNADSGGGDITISSDEFEDDIMFDTDVLAGLDAIDALNTNTTVVPPASTIGGSSLSGSSAVGTRSQSSGWDVNSTVMDVITIEDDSDADDKENHPVPTRHIRRRMGDGGMSQGSMNGSQRARNPGRPVILARTPSAVIDLSDSDE